MLSHATLDGEPISDFTLEDEINKGWTGSVSFANKPSITLPDLSTGILSVRDRFGSILNSPPMLYRKRTKRFSMSQGWSGSYSLMDLVSWKMSNGALSFPTFLSPASTADVISAVATAAGITATGAPTIPLWKEDFKQVDAWSVFRRIAIIAGMQIVITSTGAHFINNAATSTGWSLVTEDEEASNDPMERFGRLYCSKNLGMGAVKPEQYYGFDAPGYVTNQPLQSPLSLAFPYDFSHAGSLGWVGFWDASDRLISLHSMGASAEGITIPLDGVWPAVKFSAWVYPSPYPPYNTDVRMRVLGVPAVSIPVGIDPAIARELGTGRGFPQPFSDTMIPSEVFAIAHYADWLREINRHTFTVGSDGPLQCAAKLLLPHSFDGHSGRVEKASWRGSSRGGSSSFITEVAA